MGGQQQAAVLNGSVPQQTGPQPAGWGVIRPESPWLDGRGQVRKWML